MSIAILVDAKNALYRVVHAHRANNRDYEVKYHQIVLLLKQFSQLIIKYHPSSFHVFWDAPRETVWRRSILQTYKDRQGGEKHEEVSCDIKKLTKIAIRLFSNMNIRQYYRDKMESDDLIYAAVTILHPGKSIVVSTDGDMMQIPFLYSSATVYNPIKMQEAKLPKHNPVFTKSLIGDKSDIIDGYRGIGPKKCEALLDDQRKLQEFLDREGREIYVRNLSLIDLSVCPNLLDNKTYIQRNMAKPVKYDRQEVLNMISKYKLIGLDIELNNIMPHFMNLR